MCNSCEHVSIYGTAYSTYYTVLRTYVVLIVLSGICVVLRHLIYVDFCSEATSSANRNKNDASHCLLPIGARVLSSDFKGFHRFQEVPESGGGRI